MIGGAHRVASSNAIVAGLRRLDDLLQQSWSRTPAQRGLGSVREAMARLTEGRLLVFADGDRSDLSLQSRAIPVGHSEIHALSWRGREELETLADRCREERVALYVPLSGSFHASQAGAAARAEPGELLVATQPGALRRHWRGPLEMLVLLVSRGDLTALMSDAGRVELAASPALAVRRIEEHSVLLRMIETVLADAGENAPQLIGRRAASTEDLLVKLALRAVVGETGRTSRNAAMAGPAPYYVKRAQRFIEENATEPIDVEALVAAAGVSKRTLYYGFRRFLGGTPFQSLMETRIAMARKMLERESDQPVNIARLAMDVGYRSPSHFARDYRMLVGEPPSQTARRHVVVEPRGRGRARPRP